MADWGNILSVLGATLKDATPDSQGGALESLLQRRDAQKRAQQEQEALEPFLRMMQGQAAPEPTMKGPGIDGNPIGAASSSGSAFPDPQAAARAMIPALLQSQGAKALPQIFQMLKGAQPAPEQSQYIEGPDGIYQATPKGVSRIQAYPQAPKSAPPGFMWVGDRLQLIPGYAEGVGAISGTRRDAVVSRPMPRVGGGGRSGGGKAGGFTPRPTGRTY